MRVKIKKRLVKEDIKIGVEMSKVNFWKKRKGVDVKRSIIIKI